MTPSVTEIRHDVLLALESAAGATDAALEAVMAVVGPALCSEHDQAYANGAREALLSLAGDLERMAARWADAGIGESACALGDAAKLARERAGVQS